jgi:hypothetical protein
MDLVARGDALHRAEPRPRVARVARRVRRIAATKASSNAARTARTTTKRLPAMQLCPPLTNSRSGAHACRVGDVGVLEDDVSVEPPSSRTHFFSAPPAAAATLRPAPTLPVSVTRGDAGPRSAPRSPLGPATVRTGLSESRPRGNTDSIASAQPGTLLACLRTPPLPAIRAGAAKRKTCQNGKFHGMTASTTPSGLKVTNAFGALDRDRLAREIARACSAKCSQAWRTCRPRRGRR